MVLARFSEVHKIDKFSYKELKLNYIMYESEYLDDPIWLKLHIINDL